MSEIVPTADTFATKEAFTAFMREVVRPDRGDEADELLQESNFVCDLAEDGWPEYDLWLTILVRLYDGGELTSREREQAHAYYICPDGQDVPPEYRLERAP